MTGKANGPRNQLADNERKLGSEALKGEFVARHLPQSVDLIVACGMPRAGSTWLYNAVRLLMIASGKSVYSCWINDFDINAATRAEVVVVKIHDKSDALSRRARKILTCHRDLRDVARSAVDMEFVPSENVVVPYLRDCIEVHAFWVAKAHMDIRYEGINENAEGLIGEMMEVLGVVPSAAACGGIARSLARLESPAEVGAEGHDSTTLMHVRHRLDGRWGSWEGALGAHTVAAISVEFGEWLSRYGYIVG